MLVDVKVPDLYCTENALSVARAGPALTDDHAQGFDQERAQQRQAKDDAAAIFVGRDTVRHGSDDAGDDGKGETPALDGRQLGLDTVILAPRVRLGVLDIRIEALADDALLDLAYADGQERRSKLDDEEQGQAKDRNFYPACGSSLAVAAVVCAWRGRVRAIVGRSSGAVR